MASHILPPATHPNASTAVLAPPFLGKVIEICIVSPNAYATMDGLLELGIGPFTVHHFHPGTVSDMTYRGAPSDFSLRVCFAQQGDMTWEIMQPLTGSSNLWDFLDRNDGRSGIQHIAFDCKEGPMALPPAERVREFQRRGFELVQSGTWHGKRGTCQFFFFDVEEAVGTCFETIEFSDDWLDPEDSVLYPPRTITNGEDTVGHDQT